MRHRQRHAHKTILEHLRAELSTGGWFAEAGPYQAIPVTLIDYEPVEAGQTPALNTVAVSIDHQGDDLPDELGGGLYRCDYTLFVDVYGENEPIGISIADDVKQALVDRVIPLLDYTTDPAGVDADGQIEFEHILVEKIPTATSTIDKRSWRVVKATACCYF